MFGPILAAVIPVLATAGLGFAGSVRAGHSRAMFTPLVVDIGTPCLIFGTFARTTIAPAQFATIALASTTAIACSSLVAAIVLPLAGLRLRTFLPSLTPEQRKPGVAAGRLCLRGSRAGLRDRLYAICMIGQFTVGQAIAAGSETGAACYGCR